MAAGRMPKGWLIGPLGLIPLLILAALLIWRDDILQALLDPELPFAVYKPPPAPDYDRPAAWALLPGPLKAGDPPADVFFIHPTTFDGGRNWNGPIGDRAADRILYRVMLPNYAGPFASVGRVYAPRYRQASLYTSLSLFDDAIEARQFAYGDIRAAFAAFLARVGPGRPFIVAGVEQGGALAARLVNDEIAPDPDLRRRLVAAYLMETVVPAVDEGPGGTLPPCEDRARSGCVVAWISAGRLDFGKVHKILTRSLVWNAKGALVGLNGRPVLCVNPLLGAATEADAPPRLNRGAANATGLEWGARPGFMARQVEAQCVDGLLRFSRPRSASLRPSGAWAERLRAAPYNLFWADLEEDATARLAAWTAGAARGQARANARRPTRSGFGGECASPSR